MTLEFMESFDHANRTAMSAKAWTVSLGNAGSDITTGRFGSGWLWAHTFDAISRVLPATATKIVGFAIKFQTLYVASVTKLMVFYDGATIHLDVRTNAAGRLEVYRGDDTLLGTGTKVLTTGIWYYVEIKLTIHDTTGVVVVKVDGVTDINLTGTDTRNAGNASVDKIHIGSVGGNSSVDQTYDDLYVLNDSGSTNNDFLGDCRVQALLPSGAGTTTNLTPSAGANYAAVDETTPNDDTDYVESSTVGNKDTYAYGDLTSTSGTVYGVQVSPYAKKTDAGTRSIASVARLSGTEVDSAASALSTSYQYLPDIRETKPGGGAWTISDVNSAEFGVKVSA